MLRSRPIKMEEAGGQKEKGKSREEWKRWKKRGRRERSCWHCLSKHGPRERISSKPTELPVPLSVVL